MKGIYKYTDLKTGEIVYIGRDSNIDKNIRHNHHKAPSKYNAQRFNRVLQNNPDRYEYGVICEYSDLTDDKLNWMECMEIMKHKFLYDELPKFNFNVGGDGNTGFRHTEETKQKISEKLKGENHPNYDKHHSEETKKKISIAQNTTGYLNVSKSKDKTCKQGFVWRYCYYEDRKQKSISSVDLNKLEQKVKAKGLKWECIN